MKPKPFKTVPPGTELLGCASSAESFGETASACGVNGVEKGCAAEADVAAGGPSWVADGGPRGAVVAIVKGEIEGEVAAERERRRDGGQQEKEWGRRRKGLIRERQRTQIMIASY